MRQSLSIRAAPHSRILTVPQEMFLPRCAVSSTEPTGHIRTRHAGAHRRGSCPCGLFSFGKRPSRIAVFAASGRIIRELSSSCGTKM